MTLPPTLSQSSFTPAAPSGNGPLAPAPASASFEQMRLKPCGEGERDSCSERSQCHVLYAPCASQALTLATPIGGCCASPIDIVLGEPPPELDEPHASAPSPSAERTIHPAKTVLVFMPHFLLESDAVGHRAHEALRSSAPRGICERF